MTTTTPRRILSGRALLAPLVLATGCLAASALFSASPALAFKVEAVEVV